MKWVGLKRLTESIKSEPFIEAQVKANNVKSTCKNRQEITMKTHEWLNRHQDKDWGEGGGLDYLYT